MKNKFFKIIASISICFCFIFIAVGSGESDSKQEFKKGRICTRCKKPIPDDDRVNNLGYCKDCYYNFYKEAMKE